MNGDHARLIREAERRLKRQLGQNKTAPAVPAPTATLTAEVTHALTGSGAARVDAWFARRGLTPFAFQREVWTRYRAGESGLVHAATGTGKTLAAWLGAVMEALDTAPHERRLQVIWVTPMRALAADTLQALAAPLGELGLPWRVGLRTGDTTPADRARQERASLQAMVTTPESLSLLLTRKDLATTFGALRLVVVDEWHELLGSKRGVQVELALARLRHLAPGLRVWGLSATLGNLDEARDVLLGGAAGANVAGVAPKAVTIDALIPDDIRTYPWAGHLGTRAVGAVADAIDEGGTTLVFTNVRSQAEAWYQALLERRPDWAGVLGLHHGSLDLATRRWVEDGLRTGTLKAAVCTSSLDLGVDFSPVDRVIQIGSPKGVARLLQRAGRSGHRPDATSRITCVPTHALELVETAAVREAVERRAVEARAPLTLPLDVLVQHIVTLAAGDGFAAAALYDEVRATHAFRELSPAAWAWVLDFASGGGVLSAYPEYRRIVEGDDGCWRIVDERLARRHRQQVGTIVADASVNVQYVRGAKLGTVEESFVARLKAGDRFTLGGKVLEFVRLRDMTAWVRRARTKRAVVPRWMGGKLALSSELAHAIQDELERAARDVTSAPETQALRPLLELQRRHSHLPAANEMLLERHRTREGWHLCVFPFAGRHVNAALAAVMAWRLAQARPATFAMAFNDYGYELTSATEIAIDEATLRTTLAADGALDALIAGINDAELARRHFREIARIVGLVHQGYPGEGRSAKQLQATSGLIYDVYARHDPDNPLLAQARREVLERELDIRRFLATLPELAARRWVLREPQRMTPFALPLIAEQLRNTLSTEEVADRVARMQLAMQEGRARA